MNILIATDSYKGSLSSLQAASAMEKGILRVLPMARCTKVPMADGGEGTVQALLDARGGKFVYRKVCGPCGSPVRARYGVLGDGQTAVIEMAEASGLPLVEGKKKNPLIATTYGTGELMADALDKGVRELIIGIGGSATNDGGAGMAQALGIGLLAASGRRIQKPVGGGMLNQVSGLDMSTVHPALAGCKVVVACDVNNPLCGTRGASHVFGPQKGATPVMVEKLDANLRWFAQLVKKQLGVNILTMKGAGAAGGLGGGLVAFTGASLESGVDIVIRACGLEKRLKRADLVFTGEGRIDRQTPFGKTPAGVAKVAETYQVPVIAIGGSLADDAGRVFKSGIDGLESAIARDMDLEEAMAGAAKYISNAAERALRLVLIGKTLAENNKR